MIKITLKSFRELNFDNSPEMWNEQTVIVYNACKEKFGITILDVIEGSTPKVIFAPRNGCGNIKAEGTVSGNDMIIRIDPEVVVGDQFGKKGWEFGFDENLDKASKKLAEELRRLGTPPVTSSESPLGPDWCF